jgi:hypothetical protein
MQVIYKKSSKRSEEMSLVAVSYPYKKLKNMILEGFTHCFLFVRVHKEFSIKKVQEKFASKNKNVYICNVFHVITCSVKDM